jgi:EmrB/QacA subfamily drug resistance transporter
LKKQELPSYQHNLSRAHVIAALGGTMASLFLGAVSMTITATAMPRIITELGGFSQYALVFTVYIIAETISLPLTGKLSDMYGRKWFFVAGMSLYVFGSLLSGLSQSMNQLIISRALQGFGFGAMNSLGFIVIADLFPPAERGKYIGLMAGVFGFATVIGPTLGGFLTDTLSWRWCFLVTVPVGILIIFLFIFMFPHLEPAGKRHKIDLPGIIFMSFSIIPLMLALNWAGNSYAWGSPVIISLLIFSVIMAAIFIYVEKKAPEPIIPLKLFNNRVVAVSSVVVFFQGAAFFPIMMFVPLFFQGVLGASATKSGGFMTPMMFGMAFGSFVGGQFISRAGGYYRLLTTIGFVISCIGFILLTGMSPATTFLAASVYIFITGFGNGNIMPIHTLAVQNTVPYAVMGSATSIISLLRPLGGVFGMAIVGSFMNHRFASLFFNNLPDAIKSVVSHDQLARIVDNPQALLNPKSYTSLESLFDGAGPQSSVLFMQLLASLREALNSALTQSFMIFLFIMIVAMLVNLLLKGIPKHLSKQQIAEQAAGSLI